MSLTADTWPCQVLRVFEGLREPQVLLDLLDLAVLSGRLGLQVKEENQVHQEEEGYQEDLELQASKVCSVKYYSSYHQGQILLVGARGQHWGWIIIYYSLKQWAKQRQFHSFDTVY